MEYTKHLAQFATQIQYADLPSQVIARAAELALHTWGVQLAGSTLPWGKAAYRYVMNEGTGTKSTVLNYGLKTSTVNAAFANGTFGHGFEMDDNHAATGVKGGCVVVPAALAVGEQKFSSGRDFLLAMVAAYEVMIRIGLSVHPALYNGPFHPNGTCGPFGSAVAAARLMRFDEATMLQAISIAAGHSAGLKEAPITGRGHLKRLYGGMAASSGVRSALLASEGLTGPVTMLEGEHGFCRAIGGPDPNLAELTRALGSDWQIMKVHYKVYAQDGFIQPMTEALERMVKRHGFGAGDIADIQAGTNRVAHTRVIGVIREPNDLTSAQFSANFSLALFLVKGGAGFHEYTDENLVDPEVVALSRKIHTYVDDEIEAEYQRTRPRGARITVRLNSGQTYTDCVPDLRAMTADDVDQKFRRLATVAVSEEKCERLIKTVRGLEEVRDVSTLVPLLSR